MATGKGCHFYIDTVKTNFSANSGGSDHVRDGYAGRSCGRRPCCHACGHVRSYYSVRDGGVDIRDGAGCACRTCPVLKL